MNQRLRTEWEEGGVGRVIVSFANCRGESDELCLL